MTERIIIAKTEITMLERDECAVVYICLTARGMVVAYHDHAFKAPTTGCMIAAGQIVLGGECTGGLSPSGIKREF